MHRSVCAGTAPTYQLGWAIMMSAEVLGMEISSSYRRVDQLSAEQRRALESLLGRELRADEAVSVRASGSAIVKLAPEGAALDEAYQKLQDRIRETTDRTQGVADAEIEAAIEEALDDLERSRR